jgi:hypothetical protein
VRDYPNIKNLREEIKLQVDLDGNGLYNSVERAYFSMEYYHRENLSKLDETLVDDPDLAELIRVSKSNPAQPAAYTINQKRANMLNLPFAAFTADRSYMNILNSYPLVDFNGWRSHTFTNAVNREHAYIYLNAAYAARDTTSGTKS